MINLIAWIWSVAAGPRLANRMPKPHHRAAGSLAWLASAVVFVAVSAGGSAKAATLEARPSQSSVDVGDAVEVYLVVTGLGAGTAPSLGSYNVELSYDQGVFAFDGYTPSRVLGDTDLHTMSEGAVVGSGTIEFYAVSFWPDFDLLSRQDGTVTLLTARFTATASGEPSFDASLVAPLGDEHGDPIDGAAGVPPTALPDLVPLAMGSETTHNALDVAVLVDTRNQPAEDIDDPRDLDGDGFVTMLDARIYAAGCASAASVNVRQFCKVLGVDLTRCGDAGYGYTCGVRSAIETGTYWPIDPEVYPNQQCNAGTECPAVVAEDIISPFFRGEFGPYQALHIVCNPVGSDIIPDYCTNPRSELMFVCPEGIEPGEEKAFCTALWSGWRSTIGRNPILYDDFTCSPSFDFHEIQPFAFCDKDETATGLASAECCATARDCEECANMRGCFNGFTGTFPDYGTWLCTNVDELDLACTEHYELGTATLLPMPFLDADGDGVSDDNDRCPGTPANPPDVDADGCTSDQRTDVDGDGVGNDVDACPGTAPGAVVDAAGCADAQRDDDGDGVPNGGDLCPFTGTGPIDEAGCTDEQNFGLRGWGFGVEVNLMVAKTESVDPVIAGSGAGNLVHTVTVTNVGPADASQLGCAVSRLPLPVTGIKVGPADASGVIISDVLGLPAGVGVDSVVASAGTFASPIWTLGDLASGASETLTATLTVGPAAAPGTDVITDAARVIGANQPLTSTGDDADDEATSIASAPCGLADLDCDGDLDLRDFGRFQGCFGVADPLGCNPIATPDLDGSGQVDLDDYALFFTEVTGPGL